MLLRPVEHLELCGASVGDEGPPAKRRTQQRGDRSRPQGAAGKDYGWSRRGTARYRAAGLRANIGMERQLPSRSRRRTRPIPAGTPGLPLEAARDSPRLPPGAARRGAEPASRAKAPGTPSRRLSAQHDPRERRDRAQATSTGPQPDSRLQRRPPPPLRLSRRDSPGSAAGDANAEPIPPPTCAPGRRARRRAAARDATDGGGSGQALPLLVPERPRPSRLARGGACCRWAGRHLAAASRPALPPAAPLLRGRGCPGVRRDRGGAAIFRECFCPSIQPKPPLAQREAVLPHHITSYTGGRPPPPHNLLSGSCREQ